jgi:hypothetical protein
MKNKIVEESVDMVETILSGFLNATELVVNTLTSDELVLDPDSKEEIRNTAIMLISLLDDTGPEEYDEDVDVNIDDDIQINIVDLDNEPEYEDNQYSTALNYMK